ncbi:MAG: DUF2330 domain-containing protein [Thermoguttaceae bacterium]
MAALRLRGMGVLVALTFATAAFGDGVYIPERAVRKIPEIPAQRAVLSWRDGQETLLISSALDSESQKLGWIIPLPAVPKTIEKQTPGTLKTLDFCIQPEITHDLYPQVVFAVYAFFVINVVLATLLFKKKERLGFLLVELFFIAVVPALMLPALGSGRPSITKAANAAVEKTATVGSYQIGILRPQKLDNLNAWLAENGFSVLPSTAASPVADYIAKGWVFAATKLVRGESGANAPHPIQMTFAAPKPVYPLKLTALAGGRTTFEIFVIADDRMACAELREEFCDQFSRALNPADYGDIHYETTVCFLEKTTDQIIGHPAICPLMWDKCILTKFAGTIDADRMTADLQFDKKPFEGYRQHFYTEQGAYHLSLILFVCMTGCWLAGSMVAYRAKIVRPWGLTRYLGRVLLPVVAMYGIGVTILFACLPKLAASEVVTGRHWRGAQLVSLHGDIAEALQDRPWILQRTAKQIGESLLQLCGEKWEQRRLQNPVTGADVLLEDSPGNFTVEKSDKGVIVRIYDHIGRPILIEEPIPEAGKQGRGGQGEEIRSSAPRGRGQTSNP